ncbi:MAG: rhomboid family intramembrane serine protease [Ignavibacteria bacterium]|jgi:membrane associated rhomboid family serine protease|nr:rhomboid family intramembrane serine protease [Ignavibacteria bacterium]
MKHKISFSLFFAFLLGTTNAIDFAFNGALYNLCSLNTAKIFTDLEFWRLFTFQFFSNSPEGLLLTFATFLFVAPKIEAFFGKKIFPIFILLISFLVGSTTSIVFSDYQINYGGTEGVALFLTTLYLLLFVKDKFLNLKRQPTLAISIFSLLFWATFKFVKTSTTGFHSVMADVSTAGAGIVIGSLVYLQIRLVVKSYIKKAKMRMKPIIEQPSPSIQELGYTIYSNPKFREFFTNPLFNPAMVKTILEEDEISQYKSVVDDEDILNEILDKINETGMASLTPDEHSFLEFYSQK